MSEFADVLRSWRERVTPAEVGLPAGPSRRTAGLRREELAALAGVSVDYIVRLEQGRAVHPSAQLLGALRELVGLGGPLPGLDGEPGPQARRGLLPLPDLRDRRPGQHAEGEHDQGTHGPAAQTPAAARPRSRGTAGRGAGARRRGGQR